MPLAIKILRDLFSTAKSSVNVTVLGTRHYRTQGLQVQITTSFRPAHQAEVSCWLHLAVLLPEETPIQ